jgi:hypothetical protein
LTSSSVPPFQVYGSISHSARDQVSKSTCRLLLSEGRFCNKKFEQLGSGCRGDDLALQLHSCPDCLPQPQLSVFANPFYVTNLEEAHPAMEKVNMRADQWQTQESSRASLTPVSVSAFFFSRLQRVVRTPPCVGNSTHMSKPI